MQREKITVPVTLLNADVTQMSAKDRLKARSEGLFYITDDDQKKSFAAELDTLTAGGMETISGAADAIAKHFGIYKQRERDASGGKTGDYIFMVRVKNPGGGELTAEQWAALDEARRALRRPDAAPDLARGPAVSLRLRPQPHGADPAPQRRVPRPRLPPDHAWRVRRCEPQQDVQPDRRPRSRSAAEFARPGTRDRAGTRAAQLRLCPDFPVR